MRYSPSEYLLLIDGEEREDYHEAISHEKKEEWFSAMQDEVKFLQENHTYDLAQLSKDNKVLKNKWVYRRKAYELAHNQSTK